MKKLSKRFLALLLTVAMIFSVLPNVFAAQSEEESIPTGSVSLPKRSETIGYVQVDTYSELTNGNYILLAESSGEFSGASYYAVQTSMASGYNAFLCVAADFTSVPKGITATSDLAWAFTYSNGVLTIKNSSGSYLADTSGSGKASLTFSSASCTWTPTLYTDGSWTLCSGNRRYLSLRDELETTASNGNPLVCVSTTIEVGSCYFYLYRQIDCTHSYTYTSNGDGTHTVGCSNGCGYDKTENCTMSSGTCTLCDYGELMEYTVEFIVPDGVNAVRPLVGSEVVFPTPSGTPNENYNGAVFVGWTDAEIDNSSIEPTIYDTSSLYTLTEDMTLYALYSYFAGDSFVLFDGSSALTEGDQVIFVAKDFDYAISKTQNNNNRAATAITKDNGTIIVSASSDVAVFTVGYGVNGRTAPSEYSFSDESGYLTAASSSSNLLRSTDTLDANSTWCYSIDSSNFAITVTSQGEYTRNTIRYNTSSLFSCYLADNTNLRDIHLYIYDPEGGSVYTTVFSADNCLHTNSYTSNEDGTHTIECENGCGYSEIEDCTMVNNSCTVCGYGESIEHTVNFIVPAGVDAIEPIVGTDIVLPVPTGTPDNNTNNASFVGWTTAPVNHSDIVPVIYDTETIYALDADLTLYALYGYGGNLIFELYDGTYNLEIGDRVIIVAADYDKALSLTQNTNNRTAEDIVKDGTTVTVADSDNVSILTVGYGVNGASSPAQISLEDSNGYLASASSSSNYLKTESDLTANSTWAYSVESDTGIVTITAQGDYTRNTIRYNTSSLFACYAADNTNLKNIQLYILTAEESGTYTTIFKADCLHEYAYATNGDGTHTAICENCGDSETADCDLSDGVCSDCGYSETVEYTVNFVVPDGVDAIRPIVASEAVFPVPTGTPNNNYNNAAFLGWVTAPVDNSEVAPSYFDTVSTYTISRNMTLYALYSYSASDLIFALYDGSSALVEGTKAIIVAKDYDYAVSTTKNTNNRAAADIVKNADNTIALVANSDVAVFTLGWGIDGSSNTSLISFKDTYGYLRAASSSGNYLRSSDTLDANGTWAYAFDATDNSITFTSQGEYTRNTMRYNKSSNLFACYAADNANQFALQLYLMTSEDSYIYTTVFDAECTHISTTTETDEATCEENGSVTETCNACGAIVSTSVIAALGHSYNAQETLPTCTENGYVIYTCANCGDIYTEDLIAEGHDYGEGIVTSTPSCTTNGVTTFTCANCGDSYTETIIAEGHAYGSGVVTSVLSCTTDGITTFTCANCGDSYAETVSAIGHAYGSGVTTSVPTCTTDGVTTFTCANCGDEIVEVETASGHSYDNGVVIAVPSCLNSGSALYTCTRCNESKTEVLAPTGHTYTTTVYPATCSQSGYTNYLCTSCGDTYDNNFIAPTGHAYDITVVEPTCTTAGYTSYICTGCNDSYTADEIHALGHNYSSTTVEASCTQIGSTTYTCSTCNNSYFETIPAIGHQIVFVPKVSATCYADGTVEHYKCSICSKYYIDAAGIYEVPESYLPIPATGHTLSYVEKVAATCTKDGNVAYYCCTGCGKLYVDAAAAFEVPESYIAIAATGHSYKTTVTAPTCTLDGYTTHTCLSCGDSYTSDTVSALNHNYSYVDNGATHTQTCSNCNETITQNHAWDDGQDLTEGVCTAYSKFSYTCEICSTIKVVTNGEPNHVLKFYPETYATCETDGCTEHYLCTQCGKLYADSNCAFELPESYVKTDATGHSFAYANNGSKHIVTCANCNYNVEETHTYTNGICVCSASESDQPKYVLNENLTVSMSISVGAEMQVMYTVLNAKVKNFESFYIEVVKEVAGGESVTTVYSLADGNMEARTSASGALLGYTATYTGIYAMEMGDRFTATLYAVAADGTVNYGVPVTSSIKSFLMETLADEKTIAELKTLAVDMLNYGTAAQVYFGYDADNLVNADLTEAQKALGTQAVPTAQDNISIDGTGGNITTSVTLQSKVVLYVNCSYTKNENSNLEFVVKDAKTNEELDRFAPSRVVGKICQGSYDNVGARQMRDLIKIELYDNGELVSKTLTWNIESYVAQTRANSTSSESLVNTVNAMLNYGDSAAVYLAATGQ